MDIRMALAYIAAERDEPNFQFGGSVTSNTKEAWASVVWEDTREKPTWTDLEAAWPNANAAFYAQKRVIEYPSIADQIDAIAKGFNALRKNGIVLPEDTIIWLDTINAVKEKYPVPTSLSINKIS